MADSHISEVINARIIEIYNTCKICSFPIDCLAILEHYGFKVFSYSVLKEQSPRLYELSCRYSTDAFKYENIIAYNEKMPAGRVRFSLMHELGHCVLGHEKETPACEAEADLFAGCILAPYIMIHKYHCKNADQIHDTFGISYSASNRSLSAYWNWYYNICRTTRQPSASERELERLFEAAGNSKHMEQRRQSALNCRTNERMKFFKEYQAEFGEDSMYSHAESQFLYGEEL